MVCYRIFWSGQLQLPTGTAIIAYKHQPIYDDAQRKSVMLKNMQWRAGLIIMNHARQKDRTVFSAKKSNYSKIGKLYRLCQIKKKVIGESAKYYKALFKKIPKRLLFSSLLWRVPISSWNILFRILTAHCASYRGAEAEIKVPLLTWSIILTLFYWFW